jgi:hypothetical protein
MYLMGYTDPTLTLAVYQQVLGMGKGAVEISSRRLGARSPRLAPSTTAKREPPKSTKTPEQDNPAAGTAKHERSPCRLRVVPGTIRNERWKRLPSVPSWASSNKKPRSITGAFE